MEGSATTAMVMSVQWMIVASMSVPTIMGRLRGCMIASSVIDMCQVHS